MKKKIKLSIIFFSFLIGCLFVPVTETKAEEGINTYAVDGSYSVDIPAKVVVDSTTNKGTLPITGTLDACYNLEIEIKSTNEYQLVNTDNSQWKLAYTISEDKVVFSKEEGSTDKELKAYDLPIRVQGTPVVSGEYKDILTFTMNAKKYVNETKHKLKFDTNSGSDEVIISTDKKFVTEKEAYGVLPIPKRKGYTFNGWFTTASDGEEVTSENVMGTEDVTVYAHWTAHKLTINYYNDGAETIHWESRDDDVKGKDISTYQIETYGTRFSNGVSGLYDVWRWKRTGYGTKSTFWKIGRNGTKEYDDHTGFTNAEDCAKYLDVLEAFQESDVTVDLYPIWIAYTYTVKYEKNSDDATGTMQSSQHTYDVAQNLTKNDFTREGYKFTGWSTSAKGEVIYADEEPVLNLTATNNGTVTLYAQWKQLSSDENSAQKLLTVSGNGIEIETTTEETTEEDAETKTTEEASEIESEEKQTESSSEQESVTESESESASESESFDKNETESTTEADVKTVSEASCQSSEDSEEESEKSSLQIEANLPDREELGTALEEEREVPTV